MKNYSFHTVKEIVGHRDIKSTFIYQNSKVSQNEVRKAITSVNDTNL